MDVQEIRGRFPILKRKVGGRNMVYFDNAATSQRPDSVIECQRMIDQCSNANIHRAVHTLSSEMTNLYEKGREAARRFINAKGKEEIILTSGTTAGINLVANAFCSGFLHSGDEILLTEGEHHSNMIPWMIQAIKCGLRLRYIPVTDTGHWDMNECSRILAGGRVKFVAAAHVSNVLGILNPVEELVSEAHKAGAKILIDGAQGIVHSDVDVRVLDCDFYVFSGHKIYASTGTGVLYGKRDILEVMPPWMGGGEMVGTVTYDTFTTAPIPLKFEAGTPNFAGAATLAPALDIAEGMKSPGVVRNTREMLEYLSYSLTAIPGLRIYGTGEGKVPVFSFSVEHCHHEDIAILLDKMGIAVRSGQMCAEPVITKFGQTGLVRASLAPYNTLEECEYFIKCLKKAINMLS